MSKSNGAALTCSTCIHWHPKPKQAGQLGQPQRGDCKESPPTTTSLPMMDRFGNQQGLNVLSAYPDLPANFPACSRHKAKIALEANA